MERAVIPSFDRIEHLHEVSLHDWIGNEIVGAGYKRQPVTLVWVEKKGMGNINTVHFTNMPPCHIAYAGITYRPNGDLLRLTWLGQEFYVPGGGAVKFGPYDIWYDFTYIDNGLGRVIEHEPTAIIR